MNILITGATGFLGRALVLRLLRDGHSLLAFTRSPDKARRVLGGAADPVDAGDGPAVRRAVEWADAVVNLAGENILGGRWTRRRRERLVASRVGVTRRLARTLAAAKDPPRVLLSASGIDAYGDRGDLLLDERAPRGSGFLPDLCSRWERAAFAAERRGVRVAALRLGVVLGREGGALEKMLPIFRAGLGVRIGSGRQYVSWIHLEDAVEVFARALEDPRYRGPINATSPQPVTNQELTDALGRALRRPARLPVPAAALRIAFGGGAEALLSSQRAEPAALRRLGFGFRFPELGAALEDLLAPGGATIERAGAAPPAAYFARRRPTHVLRMTTDLEAPVREVFPFFSQAGNLALITPPSLGFEILTPGTIAMREGTVIDYRISLGPLRLPWRTVIERWQPGRLFVDAQHRGPYRAWWHEHHFTGAGDRTRMEDRVYYALPLGPLGRLVHRFAVAPKLRRIFAYRGLAIRLRFGPAAQASAQAA